MEGRRRPKWDNCRRSQNQRQPRGRGNWKPTVPSWEKQFCKVVGLMDWDELLQLQKFMHLYENVVKWNDSAGEEAFYNAKKRFWAEMNGLSCDLPLPDPNLYNDEINWDFSEIEAELQEDLESEQPLICNTEEEDHEPVVIFGDSLISNQGYSTTTGWGDDDNEHLPATNNYDVDPWEQNWGDSVNNAGNSGWPDYSCSNNNNAGYVTWGGAWNGDWGGQNNYYVNNNNFNYEGGSYGGDNRADGGWNYGWGQNYVNNSFNYEVGSGRDDKRDYRGDETWNNNSNLTRNNGVRYASGYNKQWPVVGTINE